MCKFSTDRQYTHNNVYISVQTERHTQQCVDYRTDRQTSHSNLFSSVQTDRLHAEIFTFQYRQKENTQQFFQFGTNGETKQTICTVQYRQRNYIQLFVHFRNDRQMKQNNVYNSGMTERPHRNQCVNFSTENRLHTAMMYSSVEKDRPLTAICTDQYRQADHTQQCAQFGTGR